MKNLRKNFIKSNIILELKKKKEVYKKTLSIGIRAQQGSKQNLHALESADRISLTSSLLKVKNDNNNIIHSSNQLSLPPNFSTTCLEVINLYPTV